MIVVSKCISDSQCKKSKWEKQMDIKQHKVKESKLQYSAELCSCVLNTLALLCSYYNVFRNNVQYF